MSNNMSNNNTNRIVHTKLYTKKAYEIVESVFGQLSDGWGENNPRNNSYWMFGRAERASDGEVVISVKTDDFIRTGRFSGRYVDNKLNPMTDLEMLAWLGKLVKKTMRMDIADQQLEGGWKRDNSTDTACYLSYHEKIAVSEVYFVYEWLLGRDMTKHWSDEQIASMTGHAIDPETAKRVAAARAEREKIEHDFWMEWRNREEETKKRILAFTEAEEKKLREDRQAAWEKLAPTLDELKRLSEVA